jgi:hypothetical protein
MSGWTRIRNNVIEGHDLNGLMMQQRTLNYYGSSSAESVLRGDVTFEGNTLRYNNAAAAYLYFYAYSFYSTSSRVESNLSIINNTVTDNQNVGLYVYFYALATTALSGDTVCNVPTVIRGNDFSRNKGPGLQLYRIATSDRTSGNTAQMTGDFFVEDNTADGNLGEGLYLYNSASNTQGDQGAAARLSGTWIVRDNTLTNNLGFYGGLALFGAVSAYETERAYHSVPLSMYANTIRGNSGYGAYVALTGSQYFFRSVAERGSFNQTGDLTVRNNVLDSNARNGLYLGFSVDAVNVHSTMSPLLANNSISGNSGPYAAQLGLFDVAAAINVRDNDISANQGAGAFLLQNEGRATSFNFQRNLLRQNRETAFGVLATFANAAVSITVENNNASNNEVAGPMFSITNDGTTVVRLNQVRGGVNGTVAFYINADGPASAVYFTNNTVERNDGGALLALTEGLFYVADNTASNNTRDGIAVLTLGDWITSRADIQIVRNRANQNGGNGLFAYSTFRLTVLDNEARGSGRPCGSAQYVRAQPLWRGPLRQRDVLVDHGAPRAQPDDLGLAGGRARG